jgi:hypothetical protein
MTPTIVVVRAARNWVRRAAAARTDSWQRHAAGVLPAIARLTGADDARSGGIPAGAPRAPPGATPGFNKKAFYAYYPPSMPSWKWWRTRPSPS